MSVFVRSYASLFFKNCIDMNILDVYIVISRNVFYLSNKSNINTKRREAMYLIERLNEDIMASLKEKNRDKTATLRLVKDRIEKKSKEMKRSLNEVEENVELSKSIKQYKEEIKGFTLANRIEVVKKLQNELAILEAYLPEQLSDDEIVSIIEESFNELNGQATKINRGILTKNVISKTLGRAESKTVAALIASFIEREDLQV